MERNTAQLKFYYWASTTVFVVAMMILAVMDLMRADSVVMVLHHLEYPAYLATILGIGKLLGAAALILPTRPTLKEWAYAGFTLTLLGALISHTTMGDPILSLLAPLIPFLILMWSYLCWRGLGRAVNVMPLPVTSRFSKDGDRAYVPSGVTSSTPRK